MKRAIVLVCIAGLALVGCGSSSESKAVGATSTTAAAATQSTAAGRPNAAQKATFVADYKSKFASLASGRTDAAIGDDAANTCLDLSMGASAYPHDVLISHVKSRFERNGITPDAATATSLLQLVHDDACPAVDLY